ncbi:MAG: T9SS type A sorting domain-containing protein [Bacteroidales bacterium]|nr:T9SS type A sorting domain-containing protein [Bacteroidales bacterium]
MAIFLVQEAARAPHVPFTDSTLAREQLNDLLLDTILNTSSRPLQSNSLLIYPNPWETGSLTIDYGSPVQGSLTLHNATGAMVLRRELNLESETLIARNQLQKGLYLVHVTTKKETSFTKLLVR